MAIKPTIYKARIALSDLERNYYDTLNLTIALHPSETPERMMARIMAFCINAHPDLVFAKGLSDTDEPDIWIRSLDEQISLWIDVGEPSLERIKKASNLSRELLIYSFNSKSEVWWQQSKSKFMAINAQITRLNTEDIGQLCELLGRTMDLSVTITGESAYVTSGHQEVTVNWETLQFKNN